MEVRRWCHASQPAWCSFYLCNVSRMNSIPCTPLVSLPGKMSQYLDTLKIGDTIDVKGPVGHVSYLGHSKYSLDGEERTAKRINLIAGGTGITPCYQIIKAVSKLADDDTEVALLYANQTPDDVLLREELDALAAAHSNIKVWYTGTV